MTHNHSPRLMLAIDCKPWLVRRYADRKPVNTARLNPPFTDSVYAELEGYRSRGPRAIPQGAPA